jgi:8-oxo-dGTP pyrophosphatase MutT (NUDIX family)
MKEGGMFDPYLDGYGPWRPNHAVAALIQIVDGRYVLQLRDPKPEIFYPDHWGCFGGEIEPGETDETALSRELQEELGIFVAEGAAARFTTFTHDFGFGGSGVLRRVYFELRLPSADLSAIRLGEGADMGAFTAKEALGRLRLTPYDAYALWMHHNRARIGVPQ